MARVTFPAACGGASPIISVEETNAAVRDALVSKNGQQPLRKFEPVMRTRVPPMVEPNDGTTVETVGEAERYVKPLAKLKELLPHESSTSTVPAGCAGAVA